MTLCHSSRTLGVVGPGAVYKTLQEQDGPCSRFSVKPKGETMNGTEQVIEVWES